MIRSKSANLASILVALVRIPPKYYFKRHGQHPLWRNDKSTTERFQRWFLSIWCLFSLHFSTLESWCIVRTVRCSNVILSSSHAQLTTFETFIGLNQAAPLHSVWRTKIVGWRWEFNPVAIQRLSTVLLKVDTHDWGRWDGEMGILIAMGPGNLPAVRVLTAKTGLFGTWPVQKPELLTLGEPKPDPYVSTRGFRHDWLDPVVRISCSAFRVSHSWSRSDSLLWRGKYWH